MEHRHASGTTNLRSLNPSGGQNWAVTNLPYVYNVASDPSNNIIIQYNSTSAAVYAKCSSTGVLTWSKTDITDGYPLAATNLGVDSSGNIYAGYYTGSPSCVRKMDTSGNELWRYTPARPYSVAAKGAYVSVSDVDNSLGQGQRIRGMYQWTMYTVTN